LRLFFVLFSLHSHLFSQFSRATFSSEKRREKSEEKL